MNGVIVNDQDMTSTDEHEAGHSAGLNHPWVLSPTERGLLPTLDQSNAQTADAAVIKGNVMNSAENPNEIYRSNGGPNLLLGQLIAIWKKINEKHNYTPGDLKGANTTP
jgi:hypothetical protein